MRCINGRGCSQPSPTSVRSFEHGINPSASSVFPLSPSFLAPWEATPKRTMSLHPPAPLPYQCSPELQARSGRWMEILPRIS